MTKLQFSRIKQILIFKQNNMTKNVFIILIITALTLTSCKVKTEQQKNQNSIETFGEKTNKFEGIYISGSKERNEFWSEVKIEKINNSDSCNVIVSSQVIKSKECCSFSKSGIIRNDTLFIETTDWKKPVTVFITKNVNTITFDVIEKAEDDRFVLNWYCCGGGSLIGDYELKMTKAETNIREKIKNTSWTLVNLEQDGDLPIILGNTTLSFSSENSFIANFCHNINATYTITQDNKLQLSNLTKSNKNNCKEKTSSPIGTKLPNIGVAEEILFVGIFEIEIDESNLYLSNRKGKLTFKLTNK
ncbi:hypothetical protein ABF174_000892 [Flavobacterium psychrophilum]